MWMGLWTEVTGIKAEVSIEIRIFLALLVKSVHFKLSAFTECFTCKELLILTHSPGGGLSLPHSTAGKTEARLRM